MDPEFLTALADLFGKQALLLLEYLKVLAWPGVVLALALVYKKPLVSVLYRLRKAAALGANFELERETQMVAAAAVSASVSSTDGDTSASDVPVITREASGELHLSGEGTLSAVVEVVPAPADEPGDSVSDPAAGNGESIRRLERHLAANWIKHVSADGNLERVRRAWRMLESFSLDAGAVLELGPWKRSPLDVARELQALGYVSYEKVQIVRSLRDLYIKMLDAEDEMLILTKETATTFSLTVGSIMDELKRGMTEYLDSRRDQPSD